MRHEELIKQAEQFLTHSDPSVVQFATNLISLLEYFDYDWSQGDLPPADVSDSEGRYWDNLIRLNVKKGIAMQKVDGSDVIVKLPTPITVRFKR